MFMNDTNKVELKLFDKLICQKCGHTWVPKILNTTICPSPKCFTPTWNVPRKEYKTIELTRKDTKDTKTGGC